MVYYTYIYLHTYTYTLQEADVGYIFIVIATHAFPSPNIKMRHFSVARLFFIIFVALTRFGVSHGGGRGGGCQCLLVVVSSGYIAHKIEVNE